MYGCVVPKSLAARGQHAHALDDIAELANVAGPRMILEEREGLGAQRRRSLSALVGAALQR